MPTAKTIVRPYRSNRIRLALDGIAVAAGNEAIREDYRQQLDELIGKPNRVAQILNNKVQPTLQEATGIAQVLGVSIDELVVLEPESKEA